MRDHLYPRDFACAGIIVAVLAAGYLRVRNVLDEERDDDQAGSFVEGLELRSTPFAWITVCMQFAPLLTVFGWLGGVTCKAGLRWELHISFACVLVAATPRLMGLRNAIFGDLDGQVKKAAQCLGVAGHKSYLLFLYVVTVLFTFDQYNDAMATAIAFACGFSMAPQMLVVFLVSHVLQLLAAIWAAEKAFTASKAEVASKAWAPDDDDQRMVVLVDTLLGVSPEGMDNDARRAEFMEAKLRASVYGKDDKSKKDRHKSWFWMTEEASKKVSGWWNRDEIRKAKAQMHLAHEQRAGRRATKAALAITKLCAEILPMACFKVAFVHEMKGQVTMQAFFSIFMDILSGSKHAIDGFRYFCGRTTSDVGSESSNDSESVTDESEVPIRSRADSETSDGSVPCC